MLFSGATASEQLAAVLAVLVEATETPSLVGGLRTAPLSRDLELLVGMPTLRPRPPNPRRNPTRGPTPSQTTVHHETADADLALG